MSPDMVKRQRLLRACPIFDGLGNAVISSLAERSRRVELPAGQTLFSQGDRSDGLYVFCSGLVRVWITDAQGHALTLALPEHGTPLGEMTLVTHDPRSATVTALEDSAMLHLDTASISALLEEEPALARHLIAFLSRRLQHSNEALHDFAYENLKRRLLRKLTELGLQHGTLRGYQLDLGRKFSQSTLAEMLGVTREAVNKQLKSLQENGDITLVNGVIRLRRPADILKNRIDM